MERIELRELRHIIAYFSLRKKAPGYRIDSPSDINKAVYDLVNREIVKAVEREGPFVYLRPANDIFQKLSAEDKLQLEDPIENVPTFLYDE